MKTRTDNLTIAAFNDLRAKLPVLAQDKEWAALERRTDKEFVKALQAFIAQIDEKHSMYCFTSDYSASFCYSIQIEPGNTGGFVRIVTQVRDYEGAITGQRMSHCFVSMADAPATKSMDARKRGEIFKCATYKAPAKHSRGSIFSEQKGAEALNDHGSVNYMR